MQFNASLLALLPFLASATALGINCRGNSNCAGTLCKMTDILSTVKSLPQGNVYRPGEHIACCGDKAVASGICAFIQSTDKSYTARELAGHLQDLVNHGCTKCGSVPLNPGNDVSQGQLTLNWVSDARPN